MALITFNASAFITPSLQEEFFGPGEVVLYESHWQISEESSFLTPDVDTWFQDDDLTSYTYDLIVEVIYVRVRFRDNYGEISDWSPTLTIDLGEQTATLERAWAFTLDGHTFYVLNRVFEPSLIYDLSTQQWHKWYGQNINDPGTEPFWNMFRGHVWKGRVLAADFVEPIIWELDAHSMLDEETDAIDRVVTGFQPLRGSASKRIGSLRVTARKEDVGAQSIVTMRFSDDNGHTWSTPQDVTLAANSYSQRLEFRSLGRLRAPGRIWEISDTGGFVRIDGADCDMEGEE